MSGYIGVQPIQKASRVLTEGTLASASQTIAVPGGYTPGNIIVAINGLRLKQVDYIATDGLVIDLFDEFPVGTDYIIEEYRLFQLVDHYTKQESDAQSLVQLSKTSGRSGVRQTVLTGPVDANGRADFIAAGTGLQAVTTGVGIDNLHLTLGDGYSFGQEFDIGVVIDDNLEFNSLTDDDVNYLFIRVTEAGVVSTFASVLPPEYAQVAPGTPSTGQTFYPIDHRHRMQEWGGVEWDDTDYLVCVGEATTSGEAVVAVVSYAYRGFYKDTRAETWANGTSSVVDNIGTVMVEETLSPILTSDSGGLLTGYKFLISSNYSTDSTFRGIGFYRSSVNGGGYTKRSVSTGTPLPNTTGTDFIAFSAMQSVEITVRRAF